MAANIHSRLSTDTRNLSSLIADVRGGEIKIPQFQRPFVWKEEQGLQLIDSLANNYPIGSLLLWKTQSKLATERNIGDFKLPETDDMTPTDYVLDGQQRLTVIYSCLGATLLSHPEKNVMNTRFDGMYAAITTYQIPVVTLKDLTVEEVCPIFERINSSGTRLSTYDLMVAATWSTSFDLNEEASEIQEALEAKGFADIEGDTILKCLAAVASTSIKKEDVVALRKLDKAAMQSLVATTKKALLKAVNLLSTECLIYSWDFVPYEAIAIVLCFIYSKTSSLTPDQIRRVRQWFWRSAFDERYRGASEHFISKDLEAVEGFVLKAKGNASSFGPVPDSGIWKTVVFRSNNSRSRAFILTLALQRPRNLTNGVTIDPANALSIYNQKEFHHVYPRAYLKNITSPGEHNALGNFCMLAASENKAISDKDPHEYLPDCITALGGESEAVFKSNLLPIPSAFPYATATFNDFIEARAALIDARIMQLCDGIV